MKMADEYTEKCLKSPEPHEPPKEEERYSPAISVEKDDPKKEWVIMAINAEYPREIGRDRERHISEMIKQLY